MRKRPYTFVVLLCALLLGACLEDVTVGFDTQSLAGNDAGAVRDAAADSEGGPPILGEGGVIIIGDAGETLDGGGADAGPCTPDDCPVEIQTVETGGCPGDTPRVCERDENAMCAWHCPTSAPDLRCGGVHIASDPELTCSDETFCLREVGRCDASEMGTCAAIPTSCTKEDDPVCGCDGHTYGNACQAHQVAVSVRSLGACP